MTWPRSERMQDRKRSKNSTRSSAPMCDTAPSMNTVVRSATPVASETILGICIADILRLGGIWPPVGVKTIHASSVSPATSCDKASNTDSDVDWTLRTRAYLTAYSSRPNAKSATQSPILNGSPTPTHNVLRDSSSDARPYLTPEDAQRVAYLRKARRRALEGAWYAAAKAYQKELYELTGHYGYRI